MARATRRLLGRERQSCPEPKAAVDCMPDLEVALIDRDSFADAGQPVPTTGRSAVGDAAPVVAYLDLDMRRCMADLDERGVGFCMLDGVGECLLHEPVRREVDTRRELAWGSLDHGGRIDSGIASVLQEVLDVGEAWLRGQRRRLQ